MHFGRMTIKEDFVLDLYGIPGQRRLDFMFDLLSEGTWGFVSWLIIPTVRVSMRLERY